MRRRCYTGKWRPSTLLTGRGATLARVLLETILHPRAPYSLADSAGSSGGGTRRWCDGALELWDLVDGAPARVRLVQRADGAIEARVEDAEPEAAHERLRFLLALDVDHAPFLRAARRDPLLREVVWRWPGMRPMRLSTTAHALLAALCGQLVSSREAARLQRALLGLLGAERDGLHVPPRQEELAALAPAACCRVGLAARRAAALVRVSRGAPLARLAARSTAQVVGAICRERDLGRWSAGVIALYGLGRYDHGLVGDLGLMRLLAAERGAWPCEEETAELLAGYGEWAGLASVYFLRHPLARRRGPSAWPGSRSPRAQALAARELW